MYELGLPSTLIKEIDFKHNFLLKNPFNYFPLYFSLETISSVETTTIGNATYQITTTSILGELSTPLSKTNKVLLFLTKMIGDIDIILLSAYFVLCLYDRKWREMSPKFSSSGQQTSGCSTAYENIEFDSFFSAR